MSGSYTGPAASASDRGVGPRGQRRGPTGGSTVPYAAAVVDTSPDKTPNPPRPLPLAGITVLDLGQIYQGPYACFLMAMAGADVVKVEPPDGEPSRRRAAY